MRFWNKKNRLPIMTAYDDLLDCVYFGILNILFHLMPPFSLSLDSQMSTGLPTIWFSGTKPQ